MDAQVKQNPVARNTASERSMFSQRFPPALRALFFSLLSLSLLFYALYTVHWRMAVDSPVMHYVVLLIRHGLRPYREITDNNMPGTYVLERGAMLVFGGGDLGWRFYDYFLSAVLIASMAVIARPCNAWGGLFAGGIFALRHASEGPWFAGEREQEIAVLLMGACACLFLAVRKRRPEWVAGFGLLAGLAASIKPTFAPFCLLSLLSLAYTLRQRRVEVPLYLAFGMLGLFLAAAQSFFFLLHNHALGPFLFVLRTITPVYVGLSHPGWRFMTIHMLPKEWLPLALLGLLALWMQKRWTWEQTVLLLGAASGLFSYFFQQKGFFHHRYVFMAFLILLLALELVPPSSAVSVKWISCAAFVYATVWMIPTYVRALVFLPGPSQLTAALEADLQTLGGNRLENEVQCFDLTFGCLNALYHLQLVESAGFTGDLLLFPRAPNVATEFYRRWFWRAQAANRAHVLVVTNQEFGASNSFDRLSRWPEFERYLRSHYELVVQRKFPCEDRYKGQAPWPIDRAPAFRIYVDKGFASNLPSAVQPISLPN